MKIKNVALILVLTLITPILAHAQGQSHTSGIAVRETRRVGVGVAAAGSLGLGGVLMEFNFTPSLSLLSGYGGSTDFQAFSFEVRHVLTGEVLLPYLSAGYARWANFGSHDRIKETTPGFLAESLMSDADRSGGKISEHLVYPAFGLQYMQLKGDWAGFSVFAQIMMLLDVSDFNSAATGMIGSIYYF